MSFGNLSNSFQAYDNDFGLGHNGARISLNYFDGIPEQSLLNSLVSNDLRLTFKSLLKRDDTTKEKALNDLNNLIDHDIKNDIGRDSQFNDDIFLICWSQIYAKLITNESKSIRMISNSFTIKLISLLNKSVSKFLKDFIPFLLLGTCDTDAMVSKNCKSEFEKCFNNDSNKLNALWKVFQEQIVNLAKDILINESIDTISDQRYIDKEEAKFKYTRLSTSATNLLILTINSNVDTYVKGDLQDTYHAILSNESFWKSCKLATSFNLKHYQSMLNLIFILYSTKFFKYNKDIFKTAIRSLFKSLTQVNKKNLSNINPVISIILDTLTKLTEYKDGRIWSYDKTAEEKLNQFLLVTSKNVTPGYYTKLYELFCAIEPLGILNDKTNWLYIWEGSLQELNDKPFIGRYGAQLFEEYWINFNKFINHTSDIDKTELQTCIIKTLRNGNSLDTLPGLMNALKEIADSEYLEKTFEETIFQIKDNEQIQLPKHFVKNLVFLLLVCQKNISSLKQLSAFASNQLSDDPSEIIQKELFNICQQLIKTNCMDITEEISNIIYELPTWVEKSNFASASTIMVTYSNSDFITNNDGWKTSLQDFFTVSSSLGIPSTELMKWLNSLNHQYSTELIASDEDIKEFVSKYISNFSFDEVKDTKELFKSSLIDEKTILKLFEHSEKVNKIPEFLQNASILSDSLKKHLLSDSSFLEKTMFTISDEVTNNVYSIVSPFIMNENASVDSITAKVCSIITNHVRNSNNIVSTTYNDNLPCLRIAIDILCKNKDAIKFLVPIQVDEFFEDYIPNIDARFAITSSMQTDTFLLHVSRECQDISKWLEILKLGLFLDNLASKINDILSDELIVLFSMLSELADDYNSISNDPNVSLCEFNHTLLKSERFRDISLANILRSISEEATSDGTNKLLRIMLSDVNPVSSYFKFRIVRKVLINEIDTISSTTLESFIPSIEKYVTQSVRSKYVDSSRYMLSSILLSLLAKVPENASVTKLRTLLAADAIGVRESELLESKNRTKQSLTLLAGMLQIDSGAIDTNEFIPIAPQRFNMVIKTIEKWLDSDIIYEENFMEMRLVLLNFFVSLMKYPTVVDMNASIFNISGKLLVDSLSMCQLDETPYLLNLRLSTLNLCNAINSAGAPETLNEEFSADIIDGLHELCFIKFENELNNQISIGFYSLLYRLITVNIKLKVLVTYYDRFFQTFLSVDEDKIKCVSQKRVITLVLGKIIKERQQNQVIEFELKQQHLHPHAKDSEDIFFDARDEVEESSEDEDSLDNNDFKIPIELINKLDKEFPAEYLEYSDHISFVSYLWNWHLTLQYFENISYKMRQLYIEQLKEHDLINKMFDFISDQINLNDIDFYKEQLTIYDIGHYAKMETEFMTYKDDLSNECKYLMAHLMYELFNNVGSLTSAWFLNIRDRSLQKKIDRFVSEFISPLLISSEMNDVSKKIDEMKKKDDALSIKINKITNEVKASYLIDEQNLVISFKLPTNYPLNNVEVIGISRVGITEQKWKQWIMSTQHIITGMNGSVLDSLELFTKNVHLQFSGFEECAICYSILHAVDRKLPTKVCPTCNNRFHGACLYKWFRSSGNNTCPMCRGEIPFRK